MGTHNTDSRARSVARSFTNGTAAQLAVGATLLAGFALWDLARVTFRASRAHVG